MNSIKRNILLAGVLGSMFQAMPGEGGGSGGGMPGSLIDPDLLDKIPADVRNAGQPAGRTWNTAGNDLGQRILAAEQGIEIAKMSEAQTRLTGCIELCDLREEQQRTQFIGGVQAAFFAADGGNLRKGHTNYVSNMKRVSFALTVMDTEKVLELLNKPDVKVFEDKMALLPKASQRGGQNKGGGAKGDTAAVTAAIQEHGAEAVRNAVESLSTVNTEGLPVEQPLSEAPAGEMEIAKGDLKSEGVTNRRRGTSQAEGVDTIVASINVADQESMWKIGRAYANRCKQLGDKDLQNIGGSLIDLLDLAEGVDEQPAAKIVGAA